jgi:hypothetical protein
VERLIVNCCVQDSSIHCRLAFQRVGSGKIEWICGLNRPEVYQGHLSTNRQACRTVVTGKKSRNTVWQPQTAFTPQNITHKTQRTHAPCELCDNHLIHSASSTISIHPVHAVDTRCATQRLLATCDYTVTVLHPVRLANNLDLHMR